MTSPAHLTLAFAFALVSLRLALSAGRSGSRGGGRIRIHARIVAGLVGAAPAQEELLPDVDPDRVLSLGVSWP